METKTEHLEFEKEENEQYLNKLKSTKNKFNSKGFIIENDLPSEDIEEFKILVNNFLKEKITIGEALQQEYIDSISFYELGEHKSHITEHDFISLPLTQEEQEKLDNLIDGDLEYYKFKERDFAGDKY